MQATSQNYQWWNASLEEIGVRAMERTLAPDAGWNEVRQSGREELQFARSVSGMTLSPTHRVLDLGCGIGRVSVALAENCGSVVGMDISNSLIEAARTHNSRDNIRYEVVTGSPLTPGEAEVFDTVFANEVFYHLDADTLADYIRDAGRLLRDGGEFVFQLNLEQIRWKTRLSWSLRAMLYRCGIKQWRGWLTSPGFRRRFHAMDDVRAMLKQSGFQLQRIAIGASIRQTWFVAVKPIS